MPHICTVSGKCCGVDTADIFIPNESPVQPRSPLSHRNRHRIRCYGCRVIVAPMTFCPSHRKRLGAVPPPLSVVSLSSSGVPPLSSVVSRAEKHLGEPQSCLAYTSSMALLTYSSRLRCTSEHFFATIYYYTPYDRTAQAHPSPR
jgi:hypothetical protein